MPGSPYLDERPPGLLTWPLLLPILLSIFVTECVVGVWIWTIDKFYTGSMDWWEYLFPVLAMSIAIPDMIKEVLKFIKQKK